MFVYLMLVIASTAMAADHSSLLILYLDLNFLGIFLLTYCYFFFQFITLALKDGRSFLVMMLASFITSTIPWCRPQLSKRWLMLLQPDSLFFRQLT